MRYLNRDGLQHYHAALQPSLVRGVTQAEYDLLTEEQKKGLFVITDAQSGSGGEAGGTGADGCGEVYSTEETRIGTWIDGKPLYRRVYQITTPAEDTGDSYKTYDHIPSYCENVRGYGLLGTTEYPANSNRATPLRMRPGASQTAAGCSAGSGAGRW